MEPSFKAAAGHFSGLPQGAIHQRKAALVPLAMGWPCRLRPSFTVMSLDGSESVKIIVQRYQVEAGTDDLAITLEPATCQ